MFSKKNLPKLSPLQKRQQLERDAQEKRLKEVFEKTFYPLVKDECKEISSALVFIDALGMAVEQKFNGLRGKMKLAELNLKDDIKNNPDARKYVRALDILQDETLASVVALLRAAKGKVEERAQEELKTTAMEKSPIILPK